VRSKHAAELGLERSLFERLEEAGYPVHRLTVGGGVALAACCCCGACEGVA
jgi:hypothetical protein